MPRNSVVGITAEVSDTHPPTVRATVTSRRQSINLIAPPSSPEGRLTAIDLPSSCVISGRGWIEGWGSPVNVVHTLPHPEAGYHVLPVRDAHHAGMDEVEDPDHDDLSESRHHWILALLRFRMCQALTMLFLCRGSAGYVDQ